MKICPMPTNAEAKARYLQAVRYLGIVLSRRFGQPEPGRVFRRQRGAQQPARMSDHEIQHRGIGESAGADQVTLVFAPFVIGHNHQFAAADRGDHIFDRIKHFPSPRIVVPISEARNEKSRKQYPNRSRDVTPACRTQSHSMRVSLLSSRLYCRFRNHTGSAPETPCSRSSRTFTAGREFHPAPKTYLIFS